MTLKKCPGILATLGRQEQLRAAKPPRSPCPPPTAAACPGLAGRERHQSLPWNVCGSALCERDTEPGIMKEILRWLSPQQIKGKLSVRLANNTCYCSSPVRRFIKRYNHFNIHASPQPFHPPLPFSSSVLFNIFHIGKCLSCISWELAFPPGSRCLSPQRPGTSLSAREKGIFSWSIAVLSLLLLPSTPPPLLQVKGN